MSTPGYAHLLAHLHQRKDKKTLPLSTIQAATAHHLATLSPLPTPLAAIILSSPLFTAQPLTNEKLQTLFTAFRHATHIRFRDAQKIDEKRSFVDATFARALRTRIALWSNAVLKGIKGGQPLLRLACCGGLLAGLEDLKAAEKIEVDRSQIEDEVVISVAEVMDSSTSSWEAEFQSAGDIDPISLALIFASHSLVLVARKRLKALPLAVLLDLLTFTIASAFASGTFVNASTLRKINGSPLMQSIAPLAKLTALVTSVLCESLSNESVVSSLATLQVFLAMSKTIETDWQHTSLVGDDLTLVWNNLKTFLFAHIMIAEATLSALVYIPEPPSSIPLTVLHTLHHLSFVVSQFGGLSTAAQPGFAELRKTFYLALDLIAAGTASDTFVKELVGHTSGDLAKTAYELTCIEQLVPVLTDDCIRSDAIPLALPFLSVSTHRESYESAHSLILAVFAAHADHAQTQPSDGDGQGFVVRMIPFYAQCLLENSVDGRLSTAQLRLAYSSLVRCATAKDDTIALYCIEVLDRMIQELSGTSVDSYASDRVHRLHLTLISIVPAVPLKLLPRILERVGQILLKAGGDEIRKKELHDATFVEISERIGDVQKPVAMKWWYGLGLDQRRDSQIAAL
ncbi:hypothetical protein MIND_00869300 [Mycena indigotica]|uniref:Uncharacterized protein n=1 Tax=Mycena indigotica TaxID=2126181 RepID=A0A8H6W158_9AGAR|nr:uncharacterized protein MIND_00869300 [Mycena indigotica]KAF7299206.1 hypothetical protein MIND_00869300 [Mycena indigotica]